MRTSLKSIARGLLKEETRLALEMEIPDSVRDITRRFTEQGHELYIVGGAVRDALMGKSPKDYDLSTDADPDQVIEMLRGHYRLLEVGKSFGVIVVVDAAGEEYEIATFRKDVGKGRRPDAVEFTTIDQDVMRRDLTINALFYDIDSGEVVDFVGGIDDIQNGVVRAVGDPTERFDEDRLRILRAFRFAARMGSDLDPETAEAIHADNSLAGVSPERIRDEFLKGIASAQSVRGFIAMLTQFRMWNHILPNLSVNVDVPETRNIPVLLATILISSGPKAIHRHLNRLKYSVAETKAVMFLNQFAGLDVQNAFKLSKSQPREVSDEDLQEFAQAVGEPSPELVEAFLQFVPTVSGQELIDQGFSGRELGAEMQRRETENFERLVSR
jgi:tRNA nucleotidyltransferase/poly(A) polymerase